MFDWIGDSIESFWRSISWEAMGFVIDILKTFVKEIILPFSKLTFLNNEFVVKSFNAFQVVAIPLLVFAVIMQLVIHSIKADLPDHMKKIIIGTVLAVLVIVGVKPTVEFLNAKVIEIGVTLTTGDDVKSLDDQLTIAVIRGANAGINEEKGKAFVEDVKKPDFDYNAKQTEGENKGDYKYTLNLFSTLAIGLIVVFLLVYVAFQMLMRSITLSFLVLFSPFASITLVMDDSQGWKYTQNQILHTLIMNLFQLHILLFAIKFMAISDDVNAFGKILITIVALLFVIQVPQMMAGMFGGQASSLMSTAQSALMGANAGRALTFGTLGAIGATLGSGANGIKGLFSGGGSGLLGSLGNAVNSGARFAKSGLTGNSSTILGKTGNKANQMGAKANQSVRSAFSARGGSSGGGDTPSGGTPTGGTGGGGSGSHEETKGNVASSPLNENSYSGTTDSQGGNSNNDTSYGVEGLSESVATSPLNESSDYSSSSTLSNEQEGTSYSSSDNSESVATSPLNESRQTTSKELNKPQQVNQTTSDTNGSGQSNRVQGKQSQTQSQAVQSQDRGTGQQSSENIRPQQTQSSAQQPKRTITTPTMKRIRPSQQTSNDDDSNES